MKNRAKQQQGFQRSTEFLELNRIFKVEEFARHLGGEKNLAEYRVRYYLKQGRLKRTPTASTRCSEALAEQWH